MDPDGPFLTELQPLAGGFSGETFLARAGDEQVVVRIYGPRSARRGPLAPEIDAAVLELVRGLLPVPRVLEVRRCDPPADVPGLLVTSLLRGEPLSGVLPELSTADLARVGEPLGTLLGRMGHLAQPRAGAFVDRELTIEPWPEPARDLTTWVEEHRDALDWDPADAHALAAVAEDAQALLDTDSRSCLVHSDLNPKNLLVDPETLEITGLVDWEFAHAGSVWADLGNLLRFERQPALVDAVLASYRAFMPAAALPEGRDELDRARCADLFALVELASRAGQNPVASRAVEQLRAIARSGDVHATAG